MKPPFEIVQDNNCFSFHYAYSSSLTNHLPYYNSFNKFIHFIINMITITGAIAPIAYALAVILGDN